MFSSYLLSKIGRKPILQCGSMIVIIALLMITIGFFFNTDAGNITILIGLFIRMVVLGISVNPIIWIYIS